jgi:hypothetical protein
VRGKWIAIGLALLTVFVGLVIGVEALVANSVPVVKGEGGRGYWAEAITTVSTVVVMAATTVYAAISYDMMRAIKQQTVAMSNVDNSCACHRAIAFPHDVDHSTPCPQGICSAGLRIDGGQNRRTG